MSSAAAWIVYAAVLLPCLLYVLLALREFPHVKSLSQFFPLTRYLENGAYSRSTVTAGVSLATVILTLVNLAPILGLSLFVTIASYAASFLVLRSGAGAILKANPTNDTLQGWLGRVYESDTVRLTALLFSFVGYVSIFSMELLVGVTVLEPFLGDRVLVFAVVYLLFMVAYSLIGGFRAIVATEQWQFWFVIAAVTVLVVSVPILALGAGGSISFSHIAAHLGTTWAAPWSFILGILCMNLPAPFADAATWQRLCATKTLEDARHGLAKAFPWFVFVWGLLILSASLISEIARQGYGFRPEAGTLMAFILGSLASGSTFLLILLFLFVLGLFSAMITTADSLLLVSAQMYTQDFRRFQASSSPDEERRGLFVARTSLLVIALSSFLFFAVFQALRFDVVQLIFAIYGAHIALFPAVAAALFLGARLDLARASCAAWVSTAVGFAGGWGSAVYGKLAGATTWLYNAPAVALLLSVVAFTLLSLPSWARRRRRRSATD